MRFFLYTLLLVCVQIFIPAFSWSQSESFGGEMTIEDNRCELPDVLMLLDRSGSMLNDNKWEQATTAIRDVFAPYFTTLRFGLLAFPSQDACIMDENALSFGIGDTESIDLDGIFEGLLPVPVALTPLTGVMNAGHSLLAQVQEPNRRSYLILLTDGIETCVPTEVEDTAPVEAARAAANDGIQTFVVSFGSRIRVNTLTEMALAGGTEDLRRVNNQEELEATLTEIIERATIERCDLLDNDCDGRIDEGLGCGAACDPTSGECPCNNDLECAQGQQCTNGLCELKPCDIICDQGYLCFDNMCILDQAQVDFEEQTGGSTGQEAFGGSAGSGGLTPMGGSSVPEGTGPPQPAAANCRTQTDPRTLTFLFFVLGLISLRSHRKTEH